MLRLCWENRKSQDASPITDMSMRVQCCNTIKSSNWACKSQQIYMRIPMAVMVTALHWGCKNQSLYVLKPGFCRSLLTNLPIRLSALESTPTRPKIQLFSLKNKSTIAWQKVIPLENHSHGVPSCMVLPTNSDANDNRTEAHLAKCNHITNISVRI